VAAKINGDSKARRKEQSASAWRKPAKRRWALALAAALAALAPAHPFRMSVEKASRTDGEDKMKTWLVTLAVANAEKRRGMRRGS